MHVSQASAARQTLSFAQLAQFACGCERNRISCLEDALALDDNQAIAATAMASRSSSSSSLPTVVGRCQGSVSIAIAMYRPRQIRWTRVGSWARCRQSTAVVPTTDCSIGITAAPRSKSLKISTTPISGDRFQVAYPPESGVQSQVAVELNSIPRVDAWETGQLDRLQWARN